MPAETRLLQSSARLPAGTFDAVVIGSGMGRTDGGSPLRQGSFKVCVLEQHFIVPTCNLDEIDPACAGIRHVLEGQTQKVRGGLSNNFAFGGINASPLLGEPT